MASPSSALTTVDNAALGHYAEARFAELSQGYAASQIFRVTPVRQQSGTFGKIALEEWLQATMNLKRAAGAVYQRLPQTFTTDTFSCVEYGIEVPVDDREKAMYAGLLQAEQFAVDKAIHTILKEADARVAALLFSATYTGNAALSNAVNAAAWSSTGNPLYDVRVGSNDFFLNTGYQPNALIVNPYVLNVMRQNSNVTAAIASSGAGSPIGVGQITAQQIAEAVGVDRVIVAGGATQGSAAGAAAYAWSSSYAMLARVATSDDLSEPCIGRTFHWSDDGSQLGGRVEMYREEARRADIVRVRHDVHEKLIHTEMGFLITGVT
jgi:hypothetical protein